jgi:hypothetical protein
MEEKRATRRRRVLKSGRIFYDKGLSVADCTVRDLSDEGARLRVGSNTPHIPDRFELAIPYEARRRCVVVWRSMNELGVAFET